MGGEGTESKGPGFEDDEPFMLPVTAPRVQEKGPANPYATVSPMDSGSNPVSCKNCHATLTAGSVMCMACGFNQKTGQMMRTSVQTAPLPVQVNRNTTRDVGSGSSGGSGVRNMVIGGGLVVLGLAVTIGTY